MSPSPELSDRLVLVTGSIRTMDPDRPVAEAMLVRGDRIVGVGDIADLTPEGDGDIVVHRAAGTVVPGLIDSHLHTLTVGLERRRLTVSEAGSVAEVVERVRLWLLANPNLDWAVVGAHFHEEDLAEGRLPNRHDLDPVSGGVALYLDRRTHDAIVNTEALRRAGITRDTPDPDGGVIEHDPDGEPSGILVERPAADLVFAHVPPVDPVELRESLLEAQRYLHSLGIVGASEPGLYPLEMAAYQSAHDAGVLTLRTMAMPVADTTVPVEEFLHSFGGIGIHTGFGDETLKLGPLKVYLDGTGGFSTALISREWPEVPDFHGNQVVPTDYFQQLADFCAANGWAMAVHAVGDEAVRTALACFANADAVHPIRDLRFSIMHCYLWPSAESMAEAARLGVTLSSQPALHWRVASGIYHRFGEDSHLNSPLRNWIDAGVDVAGGSDGPDFPMSPLFGMWQARSRMVRGLDFPLGPGQAVTPQEALEMYTTAGARYTYSESQRGMLAPGYLADWVELAVDPITASDSELESAFAHPVLRTVIDGRVVYGHPFGWPAIAPELLDPLDWIQ